MIEEFIRNSNAIEGVYDDSAVDSSLKAWNHLQQYDRLTKKTIKTTHNKILKERQPEIAGEFRDVRVRVGQDMPPVPTKVPNLIAELLTVTPKTHPEAINWHVRFEKIHPFADGNGRIGRLLYLWHCKEILNTEPIMWSEANREAYYALFRETKIEETAFSRKKK